MTAVEIIEEIKRLPRDEQNKVINFARQVDQSHLLTPEELGELAKRMVETADPAEADHLEQEIIRGFYGREPRGYALAADFRHAIPRSPAFARAPAKHF